MPKIQLPSSPKSPKVDLSPSSSPTRARPPSSPPPTQSTAASSSSSAKRPAQDGFDTGSRKRPPRAAATDGQRPTAAELYRQQNAVGLQNTHPARHGNMAALRTVKDSPEDNLKMLAHFASQAKDKKGVFYEGPVEKRGLGPQPVLTTVPDRDSGEHTKIFRKMTRGEPSSTKYQQNLGTADKETSYEILHGMGHGEGGKKTQTAQNLASGSHGANTAMMPADKAISGNPDILVDTHFNVRPGTHRAESVDQKFYHKDRLGKPIYEERIDGDLPQLSQSQLKLRQLGVNHLKDRDVLTGAVHLLNFKDGGKASGNG